MSIGDYFPDWKPGDPPPEGIFDERALRKIASDRDGDRRRKRPPFLRALMADARIMEGSLYHLGPRRSRWQHTVAAVKMCWQEEGLVAMLLYRLRVSLERYHVPLIPTMLHHASIALFQISIGRHVVIHEGVVFMHGQIVMAGEVEIGSGVRLAPWVTIGLAEGGIVGPTIGDGVFVGTGAKVLGPVHVGAHARIGANAVVLDDVPAHATVAGAPARVVRMRGEHERSDGTPQSQNA